MTRCRTQADPLIGRTAHRDGDDRARARRLWRQAVPRWHDVLKVVMLHGLDREASLKSAREDESAPSTEPRGGAATSQLYYNARTDSAPQHRGALYSTYHRSMTDFAALHLAGTRPSLAPCLSCLIALLHPSLLDRAPGGALHCPQQQRSAPPYRRRARIARGWVQFVKERLEGFATSSKLLEHFHQLLWPRSSPLRLLDSFPTSARTPSSRPDPRYLPPRCTRGRQVAGACRPQAHQSLRCWGGTVRARLASWQPPAEEGERQGGRWLVWGSLQTTRISVCILLAPTAISVSFSSALPLQDARE